MLDYRLLRALEVRDGDIPIGIPKGMPRKIMAKLMTCPGKEVSSRELLELRGTRPSATPLNSVYNGVYLLEKPFIAAGPGSPIEHTGTGYALQAEPHQIDMLRFQARAASGFAAAARDDLRTARDDLGQGLAEWDGDEPLRGIDCPVLTEAEVPPLLALRQYARETWCDISLTLGNYWDSLPVLTKLHRADSLREPVQEMLAFALYLDGGQGPALAFCRAVRRLMAEELGADPGAGLCLLEDQILRRDPLLKIPGRRRLVLHAAVRA